MVLDFLQFDAMDSVNCCSAAGKSMCALSLVHCMPFCKLGNLNLIYTVRKCAKTWCLSPY